VLKKPSPSWGARTESHGSALGERYPEAFKYGIKTDSRVAEPGCRTGNPVSIYGLVKKITDSSFMKNTDGGGFLEVLFWILIPKKEGNHFLKRKNISW